MDRNILMARMETYRLLSLLYKEPSDDLLDNIIIFEEKIQVYNNDQLNEAVSALKDYIKSEDFDKLKVVVEYARLFIGPFVLLAPPYSSIYLEEKNEIMGVTTDIVENYYKQGGLNLLKRNEPADHICIQLEYMYYLIYNISNIADNELYIRILKSFYIEIFAKWVPKFISKIAEAAVTDYYKYLAKITEDFIIIEGEIIYK